MTHDEIRSALTHDHPQYRDCPAGFRSKKRHTSLHTFRTPIPARHEPRRTIDHLDPPGATDTDFPGCVI